MRLPWTSSKRDAANPPIRACRTRAGAAPALAAKVSVSATASILSATIQPIGSRPYAAPKPAARAASAGGIPKPATATAITHRGPRALQCAPGRETGRSHPARRRGAPQPMLRTADHCRTDRSSVSNSSRTDVSSSGWQSRCYGATRPPEYPPFRNAGQRSGIVATGQVGRHCGAQDTRGSRTTVMATRWRRRSRAVHWCRRCPPPQRRLRHLCPRRQPRQTAPSIARSVKTASGASRNYGMPLPRTDEGAGPKWEAEGADAGCRENRCAESGSEGRRGSNCRRCAHSRRWN